MLRGAPHTGRMFCVKNIDNYRHHQHDAHNINDIMTDQENERMALGWAVWLL
jgi:hypothetical protein